MRTPNPKKKNALATKLLNSAALRQEEQEMQLRMVGIIKEVTQSDPFIADIELREECFKKFTKEYPDTPKHLKMQYYNSATGAIIPFLDSGTELARGKAVLDKVAKAASENLFKDIYSKDGVHLGTEFDAARANVAVNATAKKLDAVNKARGDVIAAKRLINEENENNDKAVPSKYESLFLEKILIDFSISYKF